MCSLWPCGGRELNAVEVEQRTDSCVVSPFFDFQRLEVAYDNLQNVSDDYGRQREFLDAFPSTWWEFTLVYGYHRNDGTLNFYTRYCDHICALSDHMTLIDDTTYCKKIIHLAVGATIDADAPNQLQDLLHAKMSEKTDIMMAVLTQLLKPEQILFWEFYWSQILRRDAAV